MRFASFEFRPRLLPTLAAMVLLALLCSLGFWQLDRAEQTRTLLEAYRSEAESPLALGPHLDAVELEPFQRVVVSGRYDAGKQFLLDNKTHKGRVGYHVLTPFIFTRSNAGVLVNRGWVPLAGDRTSLPNPSVDAASRSIHGRARAPARPPFKLGDTVPRSGWPYRVQFVDTEILSRELGYPLMPLVVLLDPGEQDGFIREWRPVRYGPERNIGYAVQWFGLAVALLVIYLVVNTRRREHDNAD